MTFKRHFPIEIISVAIFLRQTVDLLDYEAAPYEPRKAIRNRVGRRPVTVT